MFSLKNLGQIQPEEKSKISKYFAVMDIEDGKWLTYIKKRRGPNSEPWGTPFSS